MADADLMTSYGWPQHTSSIWWHLIFTLQLIPIGVDKADCAEIVVVRSSCELDIHGLALPVRFSISRLAHLLSSCLPVFEFINTIVAQAWENCIWIIKFKHSYAVPCDLSTNRSMIPNSRVAGLLWLGNYSLEWNHDNQVEVLRLVSYQYRHKFQKVWTCTLVKQQFTHLV